MTPLTVPLLTWAFSAMHPAPPTAWPLLHKVIHERLGIVEGLMTWGEGLGQEAWQGNSTSSSQDSLSVGR